MNSRFRNLSPYTPGEQPQGRKYVKLNTNESPFPPSRGVLEAVNRSEAELLRLYSDPTSDPVKTVLAERYGVEPDQVFVTNGSDEALNYAFMAFGEDGIAYADVTYGFYGVIADFNGLTSRIIPLEEDMTLDPDKYKGIRMACVIANPNAPTGLMVPVDRIADIAASDPSHVVIVDEAYVDFGGESAIRLIREYKNILVVHTFSKSRSLAGARVGYAIGDEALIRDLETLKYSSNPYNVNRISMAAAVAAVRDGEYYRKNCRTIMENRAWTVAELRKLGFFCRDSLTNFVFAEHPDMDGRKLYLDLKERGILVRHFDSERISNYNRITIGTREQMEQLISTIRELQEQGGVS
ncbi:MAG: histidinol-phosphate transaminase [Bacillota bacterium]|nr:histidinol-phosphate transaminase [Bacillota bacterium]